MLHSATTVLALLLAGAAFAQRGVVGAGADAAGAGGSMSYSVGQVGFITVQGAGGTGSQGVQQPYEYLVLAVDEAPGGPSAFGVAPNPTSDGVQLTSTGATNGAHRYVLVDAAGQLVRSAPLNSSNEHIPMGDLPCATYLLRIDGATTATFRIIKQ